MCFDYMARTVNSSELYLVRAGWHLLFYSWLLAAGTIRIPQCPIDYTQFKLCFDSLAKRLDLVICAMYIFDITAFVRSRCNDVPRAAKLQGGSAMFDEAATTAA
jgi:hypothetical protein